MTIRSKVETLHFKDEDGNEDPDSTFTIKHLSHEAADEYRRLGSEAKGFEELVVARQALGDDAKTEDIPGDIRARYGVDLLRSGGQAKIRDFLLKHALVKIEGVEDADGKTVTVGNFLEQDDDIVLQVVTAIQERAAKVSRPNARGRSATS